MTATDHLRGRLPIVGEQSHDVGDHAESRGEIHEHHRRKYPQAVHAPYDDHCGDHDQRRGDEDSEQGADAVP